MVLIWSDMVIQKQDSFKDLGVTFQADLSFKNHIADKINKARPNCMLGRVTLSVMAKNFLKHFQAPTPSFCSFCDA